MAPQSPSDLQPKGSIWKKQLQQECQHSLSRWCPGETRWCPGETRCPGGIQWDQIETRWAPGGIQVQGSERTAWFRLSPVQSTPGSKKQLCCEVLLGGCSRRSTRGWGRCVSWAGGCSAAFPAPRWKLGRLCATLDPNVPNQDHPQGAFLLQVARALVALRALRACQHVLCRIPTPVRRGRTDFFSVKAGVGVHRLLVDKPVGSIVSPVRAGLTIALFIFLMSSLWWGGLDEDWHRDLMTGLNVGGHWYRAWGRHVPLKIIGGLSQESSSNRIVMWQLWHLTGVDKVVGWGNIEEVGGSRGLDGSLLLLPHARQLKGDLLLVDAQAPNASLFWKGSLVLQPATLSTNKEFRYGGEEVFIEFWVLWDIAVRDAEARLSSKSLSLSLSNIVHRGKDVAVTLWGKAVVAFNTCLMSQPPPHEDGGASCGSRNLVDAPWGEPKPTIVVWRERRSSPGLLTRHLRKADFSHCHRLSQVPQPTWEVTLTVGEPD